jgi:hypothetical protein
VPSFASVPHTSSWTSASLNTVKVKLKLSWNHMALPRHECYTAWSLTEVHASQAKPGVVSSIARSNKTDKKPYYYVGKWRWVGGYFCPCVCYRQAMNIHRLTKYVYNMALCGTRGRPPQDVRPTPGFRKHKECSFPNLLSRVSKRRRQTLLCLNRPVHCVHMLVH